MYAAVFIGMGREYNECQIQNFMVIVVKFSIISLWCWLQPGHGPVVFFRLCIYNLPGFRRCPVLVYSL